MSQTGDSKALSPGQKVYFSDGGSVIEKTVLDVDEDFIWFTVDGSEHKFNSRHWYTRKYDAIVAAMDYLKDRAESLESELDEVSNRIVDLHRAAFIEEAKMRGEEP